MCSSFVSRRDLQNQGKLDACGTGGDGCLLAVLRQDACCWHVVLHPSVGTRGSDLTCFSRTLSTKYLPIAFVFHRRFEEGVSAASLSEERWECAQRERGFACV